jgi:hypothetical protein
MAAAVVVVAVDLLSRPAGEQAAAARGTKARSGAEDAADDLRARAVAVHGGHEVREPVAQVVHLPVEALDVAAGLLEQLRRRRLHYTSTPSALLDALFKQGKKRKARAANDAKNASRRVGSQLAATTHLAGAAAAGAGEQGLELGDELVDLVLGDVATRRPPARHPRSLSYLSSSYVAAAGRDKQSNTFRSRQQDRRLISLRTKVASVSSASTGGSLGLTGWLASENGKLWVSRPLDSEVALQ